MISFLSGQVIFRSENTLTVMVNGVGYEVQVTRSDGESVKLDQEINLYIHTHVREDQISLFGFLNLDGLTLFKKFISVSGIGPKSGMEIASFPPEKLKEAIFAEDTTFLSRIPGIGKKTASRIILELKNKLPDSFSADNKSSPLDNDTLEALSGLGFDQKHILQVLSKLDANGQKLSSEEKIRFFLQNHEK